MPQGSRKIAFGHVLRLPVTGSNSQGRARGCHMSGVRGAGGEQRDRRHPPHLEVMGVDALLVFFAIVAVMVLTSKLRGGRRSKPRPAARWEPDTRSEEERLESYRDQLLREAGLPYGRQPK